MTTQRIDPLAAYEAWHAAEYPRREREIVAVTWSGGELRIDVAETYPDPPSLRIAFRQVFAFQGIDEGYRLLDIPIGNALLYSSSDSPYLIEFRAGASTTMDNYPLVHWFVVSANQCVDVLSECAPTVESIALTSSPGP